MRETKINRVIPLAAKNETYASLTASLWGERVARVTRNSSTLPQRVAVYWIHSHQLPDIELPRLCRKTIRRWALVVGQHEIAGLPSFNRVGNAPRVDGEQTRMSLDVRGVEIGRAHV